MIEQYGSQGAQISTVKAGHTAALSALTVQNLYLARSRSIKYSSYIPTLSAAPCGIRKCPGGAFSHKAVADLIGQAMNGEQGKRGRKGTRVRLKIRRRRARSR